MQVWLQISMCHFIEKNVFSEYLNLVGLEVKLKYKSEWKYIRCC